MSLSNADDNFEPFWLEEKDWLVAIAMIPSDEPREDQLTDLGWIGRLTAFANYTNTRMLALVGDPEVPTYELLFSFDSPEHKAEFLALVKEDGYADPAEENTFSVPTADEIEDARPLGRVFPPDDAEYITNVSVMTMIALGTDAANSDA